MGRGVGELYFGSDPDDVGYCGDHRNYRSAVVRGVFDPDVRIRLVCSCGYIWNYCLVRCDV